MAGAVFSDLRKKSYGIFAGRRATFCVFGWMLLGEPHMFVHFVSESILTKFDQSSWQNLSIFELMNLIHNHWGKSSEARNREIFRARLTAGKIIRNQDEQGQLSWGLGSCCLNFCNRLHIHLLASLHATEIPMRFTLLVPGWIGVPVTRWMFLGFIQRGTPTSQMLRLLINLSMLLQISFVRITSRDFPLSFSMSCSSQERERALQLLF